MTHSSTQALIDYWQTRRLGDAAPTRASIDPMDFPTLLPQVFMLGRRAPGDYGFRLVGGFVGDLHGRDLRAVDFVSLWAPTARLSVQSALEQARRQVNPIRLTADAQASGYALPLEIVLLPLTNPQGEVDRFLGLYQPLAGINRLRGQTADRLALVGFGYGEAMEGPRIRLAAVGGQRVG
jgi:hypothetical protein